MSFRFCVIFAVIYICLSSIFGQSTSSLPQTQYPPFDPVQNISDQLSRIGRSVEDLNKNWKAFIDKFSTAQGLQMSEKQQRLIMALEVLNRLEVSLANMQRLKLDLVERQSKFRLQLATVTDDLLPQSLNRYVALRGTTDAESLRDIRRQALIREQQELSSTLSQIQQELENTNQEIGRTSLQVRTLRGRVFGEVEKDLSDM
jgi:hypothetical protein